MTWWKNYRHPVRAILMLPVIGRLTVEQLGELIDGLEFLKKLRVREKIRESS